MMTRFRIGIQTLDGQWRPNVATVLNEEAAASLVETLLNCKDVTHARIVVEIAREYMQPIEVSVPPEPPPT